MSYDPAVGWILQDGARYPDYDNNIRDSTGLYVQLNSFEIIKKNS